MSILDLRIFLQSALALAKDNPSAPTTLVARYTDGRGLRGELPAWDTLLNPERRIRRLLEPILFEVGELEELGFGLDPEDIANWITCFNI
jgi:hypothetical protein